MHIYLHLKQYKKYSLSRSKKKTTRLFEESEAHVVVGHLGLLLLLLFLLGSSGRGSGSRRSSSSRSSTTSSGSDVGNQVLGVHTLQSLGEQTGPVGLDLHVGGLQDGRDFLALEWIKQFKTPVTDLRLCPRGHGNRDLTHSDWHIIVDEDEGGVDAG